MDALLYQRGYLIRAALSYHIEGNGDPLLLIHGWGVTFNVWQKLVPLLAPHYQLILVELPGMVTASSAPPDKRYYEWCAERLEALREALGVERWAILAYSTGTRVSEAYVQRYPQKVTQAVFLCPLYVTRPWMLAILIGRWLNAHHAALAGWFVSGWRLYGWLMLIGFNLRGRSWVRAWMDEIEQRPIETRKRMLLELPGRGRAPFTLPDSPPVPSLFVWARHDLLTARPTHLRPHDVSLFASHGGAPVLTSEAVATVVLPFLQGRHRLSQTNSESNRQHEPRFKGSNALWGNRRFIPFTRPRLMGKKS